MINNLGDEMNNSEMINRYNEDGSENLDWWFGHSSFETVEINSVFTPKPRYVRYTMKSLKKRSTERLSKMYFNLFGDKNVDRQIMINQLYIKLNQLWNAYSGNNTVEIKTDEFGINYVDGLTLHSFKGKRGRKPKFTEMIVGWIIADYEMFEMKLVEVAEKYNTNIATISNIINGKGTYAYMFQE